MWLLDANVLVYAHVRDFPQHERARSWLDGQLNGPTRVGLPWASLLAFLRIVTNPRVFRQPESMSDAWRQVTAWLDHDNTWVPEPTDRHASVLGGLLLAAGVQGNLVPDADLAALALEHGLTLCSTDGDFGRFEGLRWLNPVTQTVG